MSNPEKNEEQIISEAFRILGSRKTERKAATSRDNGKLGGRPMKSLSEIECTCGGDGLEHKAGCPRGRVIRYRQKNNLPLT